MREQIKLKLLMDRDRLLSDKDRSELLEIIDLGSFVERKTLDYHGNIIPSNIRYLTVTRLRINNQQLTRLPESISNLVFLTHLDLSHNQLAYFPESIFKLPMLRTLNLSCNQLTSLPESIGEFQKILKFKSVRNRIMKIWRNTSNVSMTTKIILACNLIISLSKNTRNLADLSVLNLRSNQITMLPEGIYNLRRLKVLDISHNPIVNLSKKISNFSILCSFCVDGDRLANMSVLKNLWGSRVNYLGVEFNTSQHKRYLTETSNWKSKWLLSEKNAEVRRVLIEQLGYEKICNDLNALTLDTWREYTLLKIDRLKELYNRYDRRIEREQMVLLKMTCPSTQHIHILRVPPEMLSAEAAITWVNHGIHPDKFAVQT